VKFDQFPTRLDPPDLVFLYTDGLTESRDDGNMFGEDRVFELLPRLVREKPASVIHDVVGAAMEFAGGRLNDDMALVALKRLAPGVQAPDSQEVAAG
jgi:serine phosphatase RsbU (regulator of sigma subunit)